MIDLRLGDCLELMKDIPDKSIDMILCDLPYGVTQNKKDIATWFDKVYAIYPRKVNKIQAKQTFQHKLLNLDQDTAHTKAIKIYQMLVKQKAEWQKENDGQGRKIEHIPHFSTWLNANVDDSKNYKKRR